MNPKEFHKIKRLHKEMSAEFDRLEIILTKEFGREMCVTWTSDGLCVMFEDLGLTGIGLDEFENLIKNPNFDIWEIETSL